MLKIYNTLSRKKEEFKPLESGKVKMYVCGPTVYNYIHIGNARSAVAFDTIRRYLEFRGYEVAYVSNFTDVDDKIIRTAKEMNTTPEQVASKFIQAFKEDVRALNVQPATCNPKVVDHIEDIIQFIEVLVDKGYAYESSGDVYFRTRKFSHYGELSDQSIDELEIGASQRTGVEQELKQDPLDFALWKKVKPDEIYWSSPWGNGRPGWHIECSVMATKHLGDTIDIHGGGQDLAFPHHENEIAQSEAKTGKTFANYWMHNGYVTVGDNDEKMSKSLGNFTTVHELIKEVDPSVIRFFMATTHYRRPIRFTEASLQEAKSNWTKITTAFANVEFRLKTAANNLDTDEENQQLIQQFERSFIEEMDEDFHAANGITVVYDFVKWLNQYLEEADVSIVILEKASQLLKSWMTVFGLELTSQSELMDEDIEKLIQERLDARSNKNFARSDEIRDLLKNKGIILEDTPQGTRWKYQS